MNESTVIKPTWLVLHGHNSSAESQLVPAVDWWRGLFPGVEARGREVHRE